VMVSPSETPTTRASKADAMKTDRLSTARVRVLITDFFMFIVL
jgi:hypothetical protein